MVSLLETAQLLWIVASYSDHSDVGLEICQQNTADQLVTALIQELSLAPKLQTRLKGFASKCHYPVNQLDRGSAKLLSIAEVIIQRKGANKEALLSEIKQILDPIN